MKKILMTVGLVLMFSGCAGSSGPAPVATGDPMFDLGQQLGSAIGNSLWGSDD